MTFSLVVVVLLPAQALGQTALAAVSGVSPSSGPVAGGTKVTISGTGFTGATAVEFGSTSAASFSVVSDIQITAATPPGTAGPLMVTVTTAEGASNSVQYTYLVIESCNGPDHKLPAGTIYTDLQVSGGVACIVDGSVPGGNYVYRNVNIWNISSPDKPTTSSLTFEDSKINFHAHSILIENNGVLDAGMDTPVASPISIWLYGSKDDGIASITCQSGPTCGVPQAVWDSNPLVANNVDMGKMVMPTTPCVKASTIITDPEILNPVGDDCFYQYEIFDKGDAAGAFFGTKVLAVSYGGILVLHGAKGSREVIPDRMPTGKCPADSSIAIDACPSDSGTSWVRLIKTIAADDSAENKSTLYVDRPVPTWAPGDQIVVTSTDYLPSHSEELTIGNVTSDVTGTKITVTTPAQYPHWGEAYDFSAFPTTAGPRDDLNGPPTQGSRHLENRAAVALLTRSILIQSEGKDPVLVDRNTSNPNADPHFPLTGGTPDGYYGGHTLVRDGFAQFEVQGVEFANLGQGGSIGNYPVHFHMARKVPQPKANPPFAGTYLADSSIHDSNTRFVTIHATQGVLVARNVGYRSIGHGYYLEDATEINNRLYSNIGIQSLAAVYSDQNTRSVPGILSRVGQSEAEVVPFHSDYDHPSIFWIMNTWNDFRYNVAVGAGTCGVCYWMPPSANSGYSVYETWDSYAAMQSTLDRGGAVPFLNFVSNSCGAAMTALQTTGASAACKGVTSSDADQGDPLKLHAVPNPTPTPDASYPRLNGDLRQKATVCDVAKQDCSAVPLCNGIGTALENCAATVIDHFSTSFNWAQFNFAAVLLRNWWYLLTDSSITDVQNGGLQMITGGGYSRSDAAQGFWNLSTHNLFVGNTQPIVPGLNDGRVPDNPFASNGGPFNPYALNAGTTPLCPLGMWGTSFCISKPDGIAFENATFGNSQRLVHIYDGPSFEDSDLFADIHTLDIGTLKDCRRGADSSNPGQCDPLLWMNAYIPGVLQNPLGNNPNNHCILPNAAISWKQSNGFYYPPAFDSQNLYFAPSVDIRHFVIDPLWLPGSFTPNTTAAMNIYCSWQPGDFTNFTDIDRQTELTDLDGSLTGLLSEIKTGAGTTIEPTISVNNDPVSDKALMNTKIYDPKAPANFFNAPVITPECASELPSTKDTPDGFAPVATVNTSPYQYVTTAIFPASGPSTNWGVDCTNQGCYGVPLYRQYLTGAEYTDWMTTPSKRPSIRMMGQQTGQRSNLTMNHGSYYIDTTVPAAVQNASNPNVFAAGQSYWVYTLYAKPSLRQKYSFYIGKKLDPGVAQSTITTGIVNPFAGTTPSFLKPGDKDFPPISADWITEPPDYDPEIGVITVIMDLSKQGMTFADDLKDSCQPANYCSFDAAKKSCGCKAGSNCKEDSVCSWGLKEIDCPSFGCYGFQITLPSSFETGTKDNPIPPPDPKLFTDSGDSYFDVGNVKFLAADEGVAGGCFYSTPPADKGKKPGAVRRQ